MDFEFAAAHESFRKEFRDWLATNLPPDLCLDDASDDRVASDRETFERRRVWQKAMHAAGWVGITWPKEYGGRDAGLIERVIWDEEYTAARAPVLPGNMGLNLVGPTLIHWGTEEQKRRHLPAILNADEIWCQGFSEPGAGSDLASLRTRAVDQGDHFVINGQKVWTSGAHFAHWIILLVRTNPDAPKPHGADRPADRARAAGADRRAAGMGAPGDPAATGPARHRLRGAKIHAAQEPHAPAPRRATGPRGIRPEAQRLRARRANRGRRRRAPGHARAGERGLRGRAGRAALVQPRARRAAVHDLGGDERDSAQHHR